MNRAFLAALLAVALLSGCIRESPQAVATCDGASCIVHFTPEAELAPQPYSLDVTGNVLSVENVPDDATCYTEPIVQCFFPSLAPGETLELSIVGTDLYAVFRTVVGLRQYVVSFENAGSP